MTLLKTLTISFVAAASFATMAPVSAALVSVGQSAFSTGVTTVKFEDLAGDGAAVPTGYAAASGLVLSNGTRGNEYSGYGSALASAATVAGLGSKAATWGGDGSDGTGFSFTSAHDLVGFYMSSNVNIINTVVSAYFGNALLGSTTVNFAKNQIGFVGFQDFSGIDRIVIGNNQNNPGAIHQMDNVTFADTVAVPEPVSASLVGLGLLVLGLMHRRKPAFNP